METLSLTKLIDWRALAIMRALSPYKMLTFSEIGEASGVSVATLSARLSRLAKLGVVNKHTEGYSLTPDGRTLFESLEAAFSVSAARLELKT